MRDKSVITRRNKVGLFINLIGETIKKNKTKDKVHSPASDVLPLRAIARNNSKYSAIKYPVMSILPLRLEFMCAHKSTLVSLCNIISRKHV